MKKEEKVNLGYFGQIQASLGKFGKVWASQDKANGKEKAERIRKGNKNFSGQGGEGGETKVQNSPKAFGELKVSLNMVLIFPTKNQAPLIV